MNQISTKSSRLKGFTLIELMIVLAIIGGLAAIAVPAYTDYMSRARITEGLLAAAAIKAEVAEVETAAELVIVADSWNTQVGGLGVRSKFVRSMLIDRVTGVVTVTFNAANISNTILTDADADPTVIFSPYRLSLGMFITLAASFGANSTKLTTWACGATTSTVAASKGLTAAAAGTLNPKFAPAECR